MKENAVRCSFIGVDLAWSERNPSGLACLRFDKKRALLTATDCRTSDGEIISWIEQYATQTTWLGIDAPIIAPNPAKTARPVDRIVSSLFGRFHAGVYPGNRDRCARPIRISGKLTRKGYCANPFCTGPRDKRQLEIFPHLVQVALLGRTRIVKYKKGTKEEKCQGLTELQYVIANCLSTLNPQLVWSEELAGLLRASSRQLKGRQLKALEDKIDALLCAYMALYFWMCRQKKCRVFGDFMTGYIIGPKQTES